MNGKAGMDWYENHALLFGVAFGLCSASGLAQLLNSQRELTARVVAGNMLFQGLVGLAVLGAKLSWSDVTAGSVYGTLAAAIAVSLLGVKATDLIGYLGKIRIDKNGKPSQK